MEIETERLRLREYRDEDAELMANLANDLEVSRYLALVAHPYALKDAKGFITYCQEEAKKEERENYEVAIANKESDELMGTIALTKVDHWNNTATLGYWLGKNYWRKGYMWEAVQALLDFAFNELELQRINITAATENEGSNALILKLGAVHEGTARRNVRPKSTGEYRDTHRYGLLKEDWEKAKRR